EDSTACIHASVGRQPPASVELLSEPAIVAGLAQAALGDATAKVPWAEWAADFSAVRRAMARTWPEFAELETAMWRPGGMPRPLPARHREWKTESGRANFMPEALASAHVPEEPRDVLRLLTVRSNDQF